MSVVASSSEAGDRDDAVEHRDLRAGTLLCGSVMVGTYPLELRK